MRLNREAILEFQEIYEAEFGERLSDVQAEQAGLRLLRFFRILAQHAESECASFHLSTAPRGTHNQGHVR